MNARPAGETMADAIRAGIVLEIDAFPGHGPLEGVEQPAPDDGEEEIDPNEGEEWKRQP